VRIPTASGEHAFHDKTGTDDLDHQSGVYGLGAVSKAPHIDYIGPHEAEPVPSESAARASEEPYKRDLPVAGIIKIMKISPNLGIRQFHKGHSWCGRSMGFVVSS